MVSLDDDDDSAGSPSDDDSDSGGPSGQDGADGSSDGDDSDDGSETFDVDDDGSSDGEVQPDGSILVTLEKEDAQDDAEESDHFANLAETLDPSLLRQLGADVLEYVESDLESRKKRDDLYDEGLKRTGTAGPAPGGADFEGASKVTHPVVVEASVDFAARVMKEICPPGGPVKSEVIGQTTSQKLAKADRKADCMNWQLTKQMPEFRSNLESLLTQVPLSGAQYLKLYHNSKLKRPVCEVVYADDAIYPYAASSWMAAERKTHRQYLTEQTFEERVTSGMYIESLAATSTLPEQSATAQTVEKIEGKEPDSLNIDGIRVVYETALMLDIEEEGEFKPYLVSVEDMTGNVLAVYRNWAEDDDLERELTHIVEFPFQPWRGGAIGLNHMIGGLSRAATGALRAILDSAHVNNIASALKVGKGGSKGGQQLTPSPGEIVEIEGSVTGDNDIRKLVMPFPFNPPSPVLFQLLGFLVDSAKGVVRTTFEDIPDQSPNQPVGTTLALIEQGMTVFSAIHARMHAAMEQVLAILHRINATYLDEARIANEAGSVVAMRSDFAGPMDVVPVSDPNIFSETQRFAQIQVIAQRAQGNPLYDPRKVEELILERVKIPNAKDLLIPKPEPQHLNAVNENLAAIMGRPIVAFPEQDHLAHIQAHCAILQNPLFANPIIGQKLVPAVVAHMREHFGLWYVTRVWEITSAETQQLTGKTVDAFMQDSIKDPEIGKSMDRLMATATNQVMQEAQQVLGPFMPIIQQGAQLADSLQPPMPMDPSAVQVQEIQRQSAADQAKAQNDAATLQVKQAQLQLDAQHFQAEQQNDAAETAARTSDEQRRAQTDLARQAISDASRERMNQADNQTALMIAGAKIATGHSTNLEDGRGINPE